MIPVFNPDNITLILQTPRKKDTDLSNYLFEQRYKSLEVLQFSNELDFYSFKNKYLWATEFLRVFDKFYIFFNGTEKNRSETFVHFFDFIANDYDNIIDKNSNLNNTERLIKLVLRDDVEENNLLLDFGSGTGVSNLVRRELEEHGILFRLLSFDSSAEMSKISKRMGLEALSMTALRNLKDNSLDGIFSSFTLHYVTDMSIIELLWQKLKPNGHFAANFHKNIGLDSFKSLIHSLNGKVSEIYSSPNGSVLRFSKNAYPFLEKEKVVQFLEENYGLKVEADFLDRLYSIGVLSIFNFDGNDYVNTPDIESLVPFITSVRTFDWEVSRNDLYKKNLIVSTIDFKLEFNEQSVSSTNSSNITFLRNVIFDYRQDTGPNTLYIENLIKGVSIFSKNGLINTAFQEHEELRSKVEGAKISIFTNSASYMGSKKSLRTFIIQGLSYYLREGSRVLDLMCGSGSVAGSLSIKWDTYISDAMQFCRSLGKIQGSGFTTEKADQLLDLLRGGIQVNVDKLKKIFREELDLEDELLHSEINEDLLTKYSEFCRTSSYPNGKFGQLYRLGLEGKANYSLFTSAYSNLYLGLRQAVELDSIRASIEKLEDAELKSWAIATLTTTLSAIGNNYGGHFAQPKFKDISSLNPNALFKLIEQRSISINSEFSIRLRSIGRESEKHDGREIVSFPGPWENALQKFFSKTGELDLVYLDAPYTRDEYSRYYHLLETLNEYRYYPISGIGRVPEKKKSSRFSSEFFTKSTNKLKHQYVNVISKIISNNCICAWSYSDSATVDAFEIINAVCNMNRCRISSVSAPHIYKAQGGRKAKRINEYLVFFIPEDK